MTIKEINEKKIEIKNALNKGTDWDEINFGKGKHATLLKAGGEKICQMLDLVARIEMKREGYIDGVYEVVHICNLMDKEGNIVSNGFGAHSSLDLPEPVQRSKRNISNTCIKKSAKRAMIDAVLRIGFSDIFTQDLEDLVDMEELNQHKNSAVKKKDPEFEKRILFNKLKSKLDSKEEFTKLNEGNQRDYIKKLFGGKGYMEITPDDMEKILNSL